MTHKEEAPNTRAGTLGQGQMPTTSKYSTTTHSVNTPVKVQGKTIGYLRDSTFFKPVSGSRHRLRCPPAWAIDAEAFDTQVKPNATEFVVLDRESGLEYHCSIETFDRLKRVLDRGFGRQYYCVLTKFEVRGNGRRQLGLWGDGNGG